MPLHHGPRHPRTKIWCLGSRWADSTSSTWACTRFRSRSSTMASIIRRRPSTSCWARSRPRLPTDRRHWPPLGWPDCRWRCCRARNPPPWCSPRASTSRRSSRQCTSSRCSCSTRRSISKKSDATCPLERPRSYSRCEPKWSVFTFNLNNAWIKFLLFPICFLEPEWSAISKFFPDG